MILDSNIIIYAGNPENGFLRQFIAEQSPSVSAASYVEVLGFHKLTAEEKAYYEQFFAAVPFLMITRAILDRAVALRQTKKMSLGDSLIAATALSHDLTLDTRNTKDFDWIVGLKLLNPFDTLIEKETSNQDEVKALRSLSAENFNLPDMRQQKGQIDETRLNRCVSRRNLHRALARVSRMPESRRKAL